MAAVVITPLDLEPLADIPSDKAQALIDMAVARAALVAPCINDADFTHADAAKAILIGVIIRWAEAGSGAFEQQAAGPFSVSTDTRQRSGYNLWPSEITDLSRLCADSSAGGRAFEIDLMPPNAMSDGYWSGPDTWVPLS